MVCALFSILPFIYMTVHRFSGIMFTASFQHYHESVTAMKKFNLGLISANRNTIYSLSMLWLMLFHSTFLFGKPWMLPLLKLKHLGNLGVDIFLFVSGISLYFSMAKGSSLRQFYRRRFLRVVPPALFTYALWFGFLAPYKEPDLLAFLLDVSGLGLFFFGRTMIWFFTAILCFYALYPLLHAFLNRTHHAPWALALLLCASLLLNAALRFCLPVFWKRSEILFRRVPIFMIGAWCGKFVRDKRDLPISQVHLSMLALIMMLMWFIFGNTLGSIISPRYAYIPLAMAFAAFFAVLGNASPLRRVSNWLAPITFEVFLWHYVWNSLIGRAAPFLSSIAANLIAFNLTLATAWVLVYLENHLLRMNTWGRFSVFS